VGVVKKKKREIFFEYALIGLGVTYALIGASLSVRWGIDRFGDLERAFDRLNFLWQENREERCSKEEMKKDLRELRQRISCLEAGYDWNPNYSSSTWSDPLNLSGGECIEKKKGKKK
jgi:hypothetical protein